MSVISVRLHSNGVCQVMEDVRDERGTVKRSVKQGTIPAEVAADLLMRALASLQESEAQHHVIALAELPVRVESSSVVQEAAPLRHGVNALVVLRNRLKVPGRVVSREPRDGSDLYTVEWSKGHIGSGTYRYADLVPYEVVT